MDAGPYRRLADDTGQSPDVLCDPGPNGQRRLDSGQWSYSGVLASKNGQIELKDRQLADYRDKLKGATPEEAKAKIDALERTVNLTIGRRWDPLTKPEIAALAVNLTSVPKIRVQIMYENALGKDLAQSFYDAFKQAGWDDASFGPVVA